MTTSCKTKGDGYERELAAYLNITIPALRNGAYRAPLSGGGRSFTGGGQADLTGTPTIWIEAKRTERINVREAMAQAERGIAASKSTDTPVVITRRNRQTTQDSLVVMRMKDWLPLYEAHLRSLGYGPETTNEDDQLRFPGL